jgi:hypothetical protein
MVNWTNYFTIDEQNIGLGVSNFRVTNISESYRYIRFINDFADVNWRCQLSEVSLFGYLYYANEVTSNSTICDVDINVNSKM